MNHQNSIHPTCGDGQLFAKDHRPMAPPGRQTMRIQVIFSDIAFDSSAVNEVTDTAITPVRLVPNLRRAVTHGTRG